MWVEEFNNMRNVHLVYDEQSLEEHLSNCNTRKLNWMKIFNSQIVLSNCFVIKYITKIKWEWLTRQLDESILIRYKTLVKQWNSQLYGSTRTFEFVKMFAEKFEWSDISKNPPHWFSDIHFEQFGHLMDWNYVTTRCYRKISVSTLQKYCNQINWGWITRNDIRGEQFAQRFLQWIDWDDPFLDVSNLSTEFLYDIYEIRESVYELYGKKKKCHPIESNNLLSVANNFHPKTFKTIGATISTTFFMKHKNSFDWVELDRRGLLTGEMFSTIAI